MSSMALLLGALLVLTPQDEKAPLGMEAPVDSQSIRSLTPEECIVYFRWAKSGEANSDSPNQTEALFADPEARMILGELYQVYYATMDEIAEEADAETRFLAESAKTLLPQLLANAGMITLQDIDFDDGPESMRGVLAVELGDSEAEVTRVITRLMSTTLKPMSEEAEFGDGKLYNIQIPGPRAPQVSLGIRDGIMLVGIGEDMIPAIWERRSNDVPKWLTEIETRASIEKLSFVGYLAIDQLIEKTQSDWPGDMNEMFTLTGISELSNLTLAGGYDDTQFVSRTRLESSAPLSPFFRPFGDQAVEVSDFEVVPGHVDVAFAGRMDLEKYVMDCIDALAEKMPEESEELREELAKAAEGDSVDPMSLLKSLGTKHVVYFDSVDFGYFLGVVGSFEIDDLELFTAQQDKLVANLKAMGGEAEDPFSFSDVPFRHNSFEFQGTEVNYIAPSGYWADLPLTFTWAVVDDRLVISTFPQTVKAVIAQDKEAPSLADNNRLTSMLKESGPASVAMYVDTRRVAKQIMPFAQMGFPILQQEMNLPYLPGPATMPSGAFLNKYMQPDVAMIKVDDNGIEMLSHQSLPGTDYVAIGATLASIGFVLDEVDVPLATLFSPSAAKQTQAMNQLKQLALAAHNYASVHRDLPPAVFTDDEGNELLSWRVHLLPYMDEMELYEQFHLDEPWDSEHNLKLIDKMPNVYLPAGSELEPGMTSFLSIRSENSMFPGKEQIGFGAVIDGLSNTVMFVEANSASAVIWTKPDDLEIDPMNAKRKIIGLRKRGFLAAMGDGSVRFFDDSISNDDLRIMFGRNDGMIPEYEAWR